MASLLTQARPSANARESNAEIEECLSVNAAQTESQPQMALVKGSAGISSIESLPPELGRNVPPASNEPSVSSGSDAGGNQENIKPRPAEKIETSAIGIKCLYQLPGKTEPNAADVE